MTITNFFNSEEVDEIGESTKNGFLKEKKLERIQEISGFLINQYTYLNNIGYDYWDFIYKNNEQELITESTIISMLEYIKDNYINIFDYDRIIMDGNLTRKYGYWIYRALIVDFYNVFLEKIQKINYKDSDILKKNLVNIVSSKLDYLNELKKKENIEDSDYDEINEESYYYMFLLEFFDSDLERLNNNFIDFII